jgi:transcriptional regulator with XRE-family HTH domain
MSRESLALYIQARRIRYGLTQTDLAQAMDCTQGCVSKVEAGQLELSLSDAMVAAKALETDVLDFARELAAPERELPEREKREKRTDWLNRLFEFFELTG